MTEAVSARLGVTAPVVVVSRDELAEIIAANPFPHEAEADPKRVHAVVLSGAPGAEAAGKIDAALARSAAKGGRDELATVGRTLYLHTPGRLRQQRAGRGGAADRHARRAAGVTGTARNWATMNKLLRPVRGR